MSLQEVSPSRLTINTVTPFLPLPQRCPHAAGVGGAGLPHGRPAAGRRGGAEDALLRPPPQAGGATTRRREGERPRRRAEGTQRRVLSTGQVPGNQRGFPPGEGGCGHPFSPRPRGGGPRRAAPSAPRAERGRRCEGRSGGGTGRAEKLRRAEGRFGPGRATDGSRGGGRGKPRPLRGRPGPGGNRGRGRGFAPPGLRGTRGMKRGAPPGPPPSTPLTLTEPPGGRRCGREREPEPPPPPARPEAGTAAARPGPGRGGRGWRQRRSRPRRGRGEAGEGERTHSTTGDRPCGRACGDPDVPARGKGGGRRPAGDCASAPGCQRTAHAPASTPSVSGRGGGAKLRRAGGRASERVRRRVGQGP